MKFLKFSKLYIILFAVATMFSSCEEDLFPGTESGDTLFEVGGALPQLINASPGFFDLGDIDNATNSFDIDITGESASSGTLSVSYNGGGYIDIQDVSIPSNVSLGFADVLNTVGVSAGDAAIGDNFTFRVNVNSASGSYNSAPTTISASCTSALDGTYAAATTVLSTGAGIGWDDCGGNTWDGQVKIEGDGSGNYKFIAIDADGVEWIDPSMGAFFACYMTSSQGSLAEGTIAINDLCNKLTFTGASQWDEIYSFTKIEVNGADLTLGWSNDYGEAGETVLTRDEGEWPPLVK